MENIKNYLEHLLESIERKRLLSIKEFSKTDLNRDTDLDEVSAWYASLVIEVQRKPPKYFVQCLTIHENEQGYIKRIEYSYYTPSHKDNGDTSFMITFDDE